MDCPQEVFLLPFFAATFGPPSCVSVYLCGSRDLSSRPRSFPDGLSCASDSSWTSPFPSFRERVSERVVEQIVDLAVPPDLRVHSLPTVVHRPAESVLLRFMGVLSSTVVESVLRPPWYRQNASFDSIGWSLPVLHAAQTSVSLSMREQSTVHPGCLDVPGLL